MIYYYGLSADPITFAHIDILKSIYKKLRENDKLIVGVLNNNEKNFKSSIEDRLNMVSAALEKKLKYKEGTVSIQEQNERTYKYLRDFLVKNPEYKMEDITIVVGGDEWLSLTSGKWVNYDLLLKYYRFLVIGRNNETIDLKKYNATTITIEDCQTISSSKVRDILSRNPDCHYEDVNGLVAHLTFRYIKENKLYWQNDFDYAKEEEKFLKEYEIEKKKNGWSEPSVTTDTIAYNGDMILLIRRKKPPYAQYWALPGGFFEKSDIDLNYGAARELKEETSLDLDPNKFQQLRAYGHNFDPRMKIVDVAFSVRVQKKQMNKINADDDASDVRWFNVNDLPKLAFHHEQIINDWTTKE